MEPILSDSLAASNMIAPSQIEINTALTQARALNGVGVPPTENDRLSLSDRLSFTKNINSVLQRAYTKPASEFIDDNARLDAEKTQVNLAGALSTGEVPQEEETNIAKLLVGTSGEMRDRNFQEMTLINLGRTLLYGHGGNAHEDIAERLLQDAADPAHQHWQSLEAQTGTLEAPALALHRHADLHAEQAQEKSFEPDAHYKQNTTIKILKTIRELPKGSINRGIVTRSAIMAVDKKAVPPELENSVIKTTADSLHDFPPQNNDYSQAAWGLARAIRRSGTETSPELYKQLDDLSRDPRIAAPYGGPMGHLALETTILYNTSASIKNFVRNPNLTFQDLVDRSAEAPRLISVLLSSASKDVLERHSLQLQDLAKQANEEGRNSAADHYRSTLNQYQQAIKERFPTEGHFEQ